jgi:hypothetical protein
MATSLSKEVQKLSGSADLASLRDENANLRRRVEVIMKQLFR